MYQIKDVVFSKRYREVVRRMKKLLRDDEKDEVKLNDFRTSEGKGRKGPASMQTGLPKSRHRRRNSREDPRPIDWKEEDDSNAGADSPIVSKI